jgi:diketogulonate reductase-like aldo/keto reductase
MRQLTLPNGSRIPVLGQGTWRMGEQAGAKAAEVKALQAGIDLGLTLIDTAEMYATGGAEQVVGAAIDGRRDKVYLVSKVLPSNASKAGTIEACERSLKHLKTDRIDLYLLHWRGSYPLAETLAGFLALQKAGKIRSFGVSNFGMPDMAEWLALAGSETTQANQVLYHVGARGIDFDLLPWSAKRNIPIMSYSPLAQGKTERAKALAPVAKRHNASIAQIMLAWVLREPIVFTVPKTSRVERLQENLKAVDIKLSPEDLEEIDQHFPPPKKAVALETN